MKTEEETSIELAVQANPALVFADREKFSALYEFMEREVAAFVPDLTTETGRKKIAGLAYKVARTKTAIDDAGANLKAEWLKKSQGVDLERRMLREKLDALKDRARKPLTDWETAEEERAKDIETTISALRAAPALLATDTSETVAMILAGVQLTQIEKDYYRESYDFARHAQEDAVRLLTAAQARLRQSEADTLELTRLRTEAAAREAAEREAASARQAVKNAEDLARRIQMDEELRIEAENGRIARAAQEAEERTKREAERLAKVEADRIQAEHAEETRRAAVAIAAVEQQLKDERATFEAVAEERRNEITRAENEKATREAAERKMLSDKAHRAKVIAYAVASLIKCATNSETPNLTEAQARTVIAAIVAGKIPAVTINFLESTPAQPAPDLFVRGPNPGRHR